MTTPTDSDWQSVPCKIWEGKPNTSGYGVVRINGKTMTASRAAYIREHGPVPDGIDVCHHCDNPICVEPRHLFLGSRSKNMMDCVEKGRHGQKSKTHCPHGHEYTPENTKMLKGGRRNCRECMKRRMREMRSRKKMAIAEMRVIAGMDEYRHER